MNILILRVSSIGDVVHTLPSVFLLKKLYPNAKISWIVQEKAASLIKNQPFLDNVWVLPDKFLKPKHILKTLTILKPARAIKWDAILDFQGIIKTSVISLLLKGERYGFDANNSRMWLTSLLNKNKVSPTYTNIIQKNLTLADNMHLRNKANKLGFLNLNYENSSPSIEQLSYFLDIGEDDKKVVDSWLSKMGISSFITISPNTTWKSKHWPLESWIKIIEMLDTNIVLLGSGFGGFAKVISEDKSLKIFASPKWKLTSTAYLISKSNLIVAPDTGLLHIADFLGVKTIGLFGPTLAKKHGPFLCNKNLNSSIQISCPHHYKKEHLDGDCMKKLTPETLTNHLNKELFR